MKKTVSVNIKGINFIIEEDAYEMLQDYLDRLAIALQNEEGSKEIIEDIELRIAELCSESLNDSKSVIEVKDIESIISKMGEPEDYVSENEEGEGTYSSEQSNSNHKNEKRLFRDEDNATIAGVCAGLANFFNIDVVIIRAIFVVLFLFAGFGLPLYIILWFIVPKAESTIDRLRMKGRPINVETVKEEVEAAASKFTKSSKKFAENFRKDDSYKRSVNRGARLLASLLGFILIVIGIGVLIPFLIFIVGGFEVIPLDGDNGFMSFPEFGKFVMGSSSDYNLMWWGVMLGGFSGILFLMLLGIMLIMRIKNTFSKFTLVTLFVTGLTGLILCISMGVRTGRDFAFPAEITRNVETVDTDVLTISPILRKIRINDDYVVTSNDGFRAIEVGKDDIKQFGIDLKYVRSQDSLFHIKQVVKVQSASHEEGIKKCEHVEHEAFVQNDTLMIDTGYSFPKEDKWRVQRVNVIIEIPEGKEVKFQNHTIRLGDHEYIEDNEVKVDSQHGVLRSSGKYRHYN